MLQDLYEKKSHRAVWMFDAWSHEGETEGTCMEYRDNAGTLGDPPLGRPVPSLNLANLNRHFENCPHWSPFCENDILEPAAMK